MNKDKFNSQDLIDALVASDGCSRTLADRFLKALLSVVEEALLKKDLLKIKDFGTFKLNWVAPRKSVNVQTGKDIIIAGYYKVSFVPDNDLKKLVNKPYAHLETIVLADDTEKKVDPLLSLSEQAGEIKNLLSEIEAMPHSQEEVDEQEQIQIPTDEKSESADISNDESLVDSELPSKEETRRGNRLPLFLVIFFALFLLVFFFLREKDELLAVLDDNEKTRNTELVSKSEANNHSDILEHSVSSSVSPQESDVLGVQQGAVAESDLLNPSVGGLQTAPSAEKDFDVIFENRLKGVAVKQRVKLEPGRYLASLAKEYYGSPHFWVYIFEFNKDVIKNQNNVLSGVEIKLPELDARLIDLENPLSIEKAKFLEKTYDSK